jgi:hypothetical protein
VKLKSGFDYDAWIQGLNEGRSFVTTGPMLLVTINNFDPGHIFHQSAESTATYSVVGTAQSTYPLERIEIVVNGHVAKTVKARNPDKSGPLGAYSSRINENIDVATSSWIAIRCFERRPDGRSRFAHTAPFHVEVKGKPLQVRKAEVNFLIKRMQKQIERNEGVLPEKALDEYRQALEIYQTSHEK